jgi:hypothetical protein
MEFGFGSGLLTGVRNDSGATVPTTPERFGALQDVSVEFQGEVKELFSTQQFPIDSARGKTKIMGKAKMAEIKGRMYNDLFFGQTLAAGSTKYAYNESTTVGTGASPSYTVAFAASTPLTDQGVFYVANGDQLVSVSSGPTAGQYTFTASTGVYGWATGDLSQGMYVNYLYTSTAGYNIAIGNPFMGTTPRFQMTLYQPFEGNSVVLQLYACVSTRLSFPTRIDDYVIQDMDFSAFANSAGNVGNWSTTN